MTKEEFSRKKELAEKLAADGNCNKTIYNRIGISHETYAQWMNKDHRCFRKDFYEAVNRGKSSLLSGTISRIKQKAFGFSYKETTYDASGTAIKVVEKFREPDTGALIFILCNRDPENWKNTQYAAQQSSRSPEEIADQINKDTHKAVALTLGLEETK